MATKQLSFITSNQDNDLNDVTVTHRMVTPNSSGPGGTVVFTVDPTTAQEMKEAQDVGQTGTAVFSNPNTGNMDTFTGATLTSFTVNADGTGTITFTYGSEVPCFCRGTMILTPSGEVAVEQLQIGDLVTTLAGEAKPITWIGSGRSLITALNERSRPIIVRADALADGVPSRDLRVTKGHSLYLDGVLIPADLLVNGRSVLWDNKAQVVEFYHVELPAHDVLIADGAPAESYKEDGNRELFQDGAEPVVAAGVSEWFAPVHTTGPIVEQVWRRLFERSGVAPAPRTDDPDLHLVADGVRIDATEVAGSVYRFRLDQAPVELRIVSRSVVPVEVGHNHDTRQLGVAVRSIVLSGSGVRTELSYDASTLTDGFHWPEGGSEGSGWRWTTGDAGLPGRALVAFEGAIEVTLDAIPSQYVTLVTPEDARAAA